MPYHIYALMTSNVSLIRLIVYSMVTDILFIPAEKKYSLNSLKQLCNAKLCNYILVLGSYLVFVSEDAIMILRILMQSLFFYTFESDVFNSILNHFHMQK